MRNVLARVVFAGFVILASNVWLCGAADGSGSSILEPATGAWLGLYYGDGTLAQTAAKSRKNFLPSALEPVARALIVASRLPSTILWKSILCGSQLTRGMRPAARSALVTVPVQSSVHA